jgi:hypothetical protein
MLIEAVGNEVAHKDDLLILSEARRSSGSAVRDAASRCSISSLTAVPVSLGDSLSSTGKVLAVGRPREMLADEPGQEEQGVARSVVGDYVLRLPGVVAGN